MTATVTPIHTRRHPHGVVIPMPLARREADRLPPRASHPYPCEGAGHGDPALHVDVMTTPCGVDLCWAGCYPDHARSCDACAAEEVEDERDEAGDCWHGYEGDLA